MYYYPMQHYYLRIIAFNDDAFSDHHGDNMLHLIAYWNVPAARTWYLTVHTGQSLMVSQNNAGAPLDPGTANNLDTVLFQRILFFGENSWSMHSHISTIILFRNKAFAE